MKIQFYNSLTNQHEEFQSIEPGLVRMYSCGPTVYDFAHIGNFRSFLFGDLLRRFLELVGYDVHHVMNITDVGHMTDGEDDKMTRPRNDSKRTNMQVALKKERSRTQVIRTRSPNTTPRRFWKITKAWQYKIALNIPSKFRGRPIISTAMQEMIHAFDRTQARLCRRRRSRLLQRRELSRVRPIERQYAGETSERRRRPRIRTTIRLEKHHPGDFMLWKPDDNHIMKWDSPWGVGYPGWHIECSVMARKLLGSRRDRHSHRWRRSDLSASRMRDCTILWATGGQEYVLPTSGFMPGFCSSKARRCPNRKGNFFHGTRRV